MVDLAIDLVGDLVKAEGAYQQALKRCKNNAPAIFRRIRDEFGWSQQDLAELLGCDHTYLSKIENAKLRPGRPILLKLGNLLDKQSLKVHLIAPATSGDTQWDNDNL